MEKTKRSLIRIERMDGETVCLCMDGEDEWELLAMMGDGLAHWLHENPDKYRKGRQFMRRVVEDFYPDWVAYFLDGWKMRLVGCAALFGVLYGFAALMQQIGA